MTLPLPLGGITDGTLRFVLERLASQFPVGWENIKGDWGTWYGMFPFGSIGAQTTGAANNLYYGQTLVLSSASALTGIAYAVGGTSSGNVRCGLYDASGTRVAAKTSDVAQGGVLTFQKVPFDIPYLAPPGKYFMALVFSSATASYLGATYAPAGSVANGSTTLPASITPPSGALGVPTMTTY